MMKNFIANIKNYEGLGTLVVVEKNNPLFPSLLEKGNRELFVSEGVWICSFQVINCFAIICEIVDNKEIIGLLVAEVLPEDEE